MTKTYILEPFGLKEERVLVANSIPFIRKGNTARFWNEKDFVRASFRLIETILPTEKDFVKGVL